MPFSQEYFRNSDRGAKLAGTPEDPSLKTLETVRTQGSEALEKDYAGRKEAYRTFVNFVSELLKANHYYGHTQRGIFTTTTGVAIKGLPEAQVSKHVKYFINRLLKDIEVVSKYLSAEGDKIKLKANGEKIKYGSEENAFDNLQDFGLVDLGRHSDAYMETSYDLDIKGLTNVGAEVFAAIQTLGGAGAVKKLLGVEESHSPGLIPR